MSLPSVGSLQQHPGHPSTGAPDREYHRIPQCGAGQDQSLIRLAGMLCIEQNDEWLVGRRYLSVESISALDRTQDDSPSQDQQEVGELQAA